MVLCAFYLKTRKLRLSPISVCNSSDCYFRPDWLLSDSGLFSDLREVIFFTHLFTKKKKVREHF